MQAAASNTPASPATARSRLSRWYWRAPIKSSIFAIVCLFVLFPYPAQLIRHLSHVTSMQSMIEPDAPELAAWDEELAALKSEVLARLAQSQPAQNSSATATNGADSQEAMTKQQASAHEARAIQRAVERFVLDKIKYEWDWNLWGSADYMPTIREMFEQARNNGGQMLEDCDGRAIMAASILRRMGYDAQLVTDLRHLWVQTPQAELMGPGGKKAMVTTTQGTRVNLAGAVVDTPVALTYGIAVFPLWRELIIAGTAVLLLAWRSVSLRTTAMASLLIVQGLLFMRLGFFAPQAVSREASEWPSWVGIAHIAAGLAILMYSSLRLRLSRR